MLSERADLDPRRPPWPSGEYDCIWLKQTWAASLHSSGTALATSSQQYGEETEAKGPCRASRKEGPGWRGGAGAALAAELGPQLLPLSP